MQILEHLEQFFSDFGIFDLPNMQILNILVMGEPQITLGGIWSKTVFFVANLDIFERSQKEILFINVS